MLWNNRVHAPKKKIHCKRDFLNTATKSTRIRWRLFKLSESVWNDNDVFSETNLREFMVSRTVLQTVLSSKVAIGTGKSNFALFYVRGEPITEGKIKLNLRMFSDTTEKISRIRDSMLGQLCDNIRSNNIKIEKSPNSDFLKIDCRSGNETFSKMFLLKLLDEVSTTYIGTKTEKIRSIIKVLKKKADSSKAVLDDLLLSKAYVQDQNIYTTRSVINVPIQKKEIQLRKIENEYLELEKNIEVQQYQLLQNTPLIKVVDPPMYPLATEKLGKMKGAIVGGLIGLFLITLALLFTFMTKTKDKYELN